MWTAGCHSANLRIYRIENSFNRRPTEPEIHFILTQPIHVIQRLLGYKTVTRLQSQPVRDINVSWRILLLQLIIYF